DPATQQAGAQVRIDVAERTLQAATTGGYTGAGTNEDQVYRAVKALREAYADRIAHATSDEERTRFQREWDERRARLMRDIPGEMDTDTPEYARVRLLVSGNLTAADELYLAHLDVDSDKAVDVVTRAWATGAVDTLLADAGREKRDGNDVLRPVFNPWLSVPVTSGVTAQRVYTLIREGRSNAERGAARLRVELSEGTSDSDLQRAYALLTGNGISAQLRDAVVASFAGGLSQEGATPAARFMAYLRQTYEEAHTVFEFQDLLLPATTPQELLDRAEARHAAAHSGIFEQDMSDMVSVYDAVTGEDTQQVEQESLERLRYIVQHSGASDPELKAMLAITGSADVMALAQMEYGLFRQRLDEVRSIRSTITETLVTAAQLVAEAAITILTGGAAGPMFLASLGTTVAGMLAREALLGQEYELLSRANAQALAMVVVSHGMGAVSRGLVGLPAEELAKLSRARAFLATAGQEALSNMGTQTIAAALEGRAPRVEDIGAAALTTLAAAGGAGTRSALTHSLSEHTPDVTRLRTLVIASVAQNVVQANAEEGAAMLRGGTGDLTAADIAGRFLHSTAGGIGRGVAGGVGDFGAHVVERGRARRREEEEASADAHDEDVPPSARPRADADPHAPGPRVVGAAEAGPGHTVTVIRDERGRLMVVLCSPNCGLVRDLFNAILANPDHASSHDAARAALAEVQRIETEHGADPTHPEARAALENLGSRARAVLSTAGADAVFGTTPGVSSAAEHETPAAAPAPQETPAAAPGAPAAHAAPSEGADAVQAAQGQGAGSPAAAGPRRQLPIKKQLMVSAEEAFDALQRRYGRLTPETLHERALAGDEEAARLWALIPSVQIDPSLPRHEQSDRPDVQDFLRRALRAYRRMPGVPEREDLWHPPHGEADRPAGAGGDDEGVRGGTAGVAQTNIPGLEDRVWVGASPNAQPEGGLPHAAAPQVVKSPSADPRGQRHAEEMIANQVVSAVRRLQAQNGWT
ncbi:MAG TPA: hypothetical protein VF541_18480, partial [Longimicrobium sp.]